MGIYDRDYNRWGYEQGHRPRMHFALPAPTDVVKWLLIINVAIFVPFFIIPSLRNFLLTHFSVFPTDLPRRLQFWRLITYQFLHDPSGFGHIFFNMLALYFFGPMLEKQWGSKRFLIFYLTCGAMGGLLYTFLIMIGLLTLSIPLIGASGAILGIIAAAAIIAPHARVYIMGIFPIPLMVMAMILALISIMTLFRHDELANAGGEAAHLAGMVAGALYVLWPRLTKKYKTKTRKIEWHNELNRQRMFQAEVDRILHKLHQSGIKSLTRKEKKTLREATRREQKFGK